MRATQWDRSAERRREERASSSRWLGWTGFRLRKRANGRVTQGRAEKREKHIQRERGDRTWHESRAVHEGKRVEQSQWEARAVRKERRRPIKQQHRAQAKQRESDMTEQGGEERRKRHGQGREERHADGNDKGRGRQGSVVQQNRIVL